jgi:hypothetical protein
MSKSDEDKFTDLLRAANNGVSPVTFGDVGIDKNGNEYPLDTEMVNEEDYCSK